MARGGGGEVVREELRQAEGARCEQLGRGMRGVVPCVVDRGVRQAVVGGQVEHRNASSKQAGGRRERSGMRHSQKHGVARGEHRIVMRGERKVAHARKRGVDAGERLPGIGVGRGWQRGRRRGGPAADARPRFPHRPAAPTTATLYAMVLHLQNNTRSSVAQSCIFSHDGILDIEQYGSLSLCGGWWDGARAGVIYLQHCCALWSVDAGRRFVDSLQTLLFPTAGSRRSVPDVGKSSVCRGSLKQKHAGGRKR